MDSYQILVIALLTLAIADLIVGVSNDAVNFLTSAIGSRVASKRTILIIAAVGVFVGAAFSSGMMEVARKGIFNPQFYSYADVMIIFLAVMITDIILLDTFNSLGLPTSTTVSIVFELLGASVMVGWLMLNDGRTDVGGLTNLINTTKATEIIAGIFISIGVAFSIGALAQWLSRILFTFSVGKNLKRYGAVYSGLAMTFIIYFLLIKGIKGAVFVSGDTAEYIRSHSWLIVTVSFAASSLILWMLQHFSNINPLKIVVLAGTFSLAMAFAGNDLVNFIGVPIAGFDSYRSFVNSGIEASDYMMTSLAEPRKASGIMLYIAGAIMVITLWVSAKAKKVTDTSINLGAQGDVDEKFRPNLVSNAIISAAIGFNNFFTAVMPNRTLSFINQRLSLVGIDVAQRPAFDLVRASVNLMIASILIAFASSLKLPLSTTYVSFMVAMGTSLADRAWGHKSAPYRVAGVVSVIGGWFVTAAAAFLAAAIIALAIYYGGNYLAIGLVVIALIILVNTNLLVKKKK